MSSVKSIVINLTRTNHTFFLKVPKARFILNVAMVTLLKNQLKVLLKQKLNVLDVTIRTCIEHSLVSAQCLRVSAL